MGAQAKDTPHLGGSTIVRHGQLSWHPKTVEHCLLSLFGVSDAGDAPLATLLALGEGGQPLETDSAKQAPRWQKTSWIVQAVSLQLQRDTFGLAHLPTLEIEVFEALSLLLNDYFKQDAMVFEPSASKQYWYLSTAKPLAASTHALSTALHQDIQRFQPEGTDAFQLRRIMNEAQMLLHDHPLNQQRVAAHLPEINSIWISGGGTLPAAPTQNKVVIGGNGALLNGLSAWLKQPVLPSMQAVFASNADEAVLYYEDASQLDWATLFQQVKFGKIKQLSLYVPDSHQSCHIELNSLDAWKFWRHARLQPPQ